MRVGGGEVGICGYDVGMWEGGGGGLRGYDTKSAWLATGGRGKIMHIQLCTSYTVVY